MSKKIKLVRCKRCWQEIAKERYAEHLVKAHRDFSLFKTENDKQMALKRMQQISRGREENYER